MGEVGDGKHFSKLKVLKFLSAHHSSSPIPALGKVEASACLGSAQLAWPAIISHGSADHSPSSVPGKGYLLPQKGSLRAALALHWTLASFALNWTGSQLVGF